MQFPGGDFAENFTITLTRRPIDGSGLPLPGPPKVLSPSEDRFSVSIDMESGQYFVDIADSVIGDSGVYSIEICSQKGADEGCIKASATVFVLDCELPFPFPCDEL